VVDEEENKHEPVVWIAGIAAILSLAAIGFIVFQMLSGPSTPATQQVAVPDFVGKLLARPPRRQSRSGSSSTSRTRTSDQPVGTILAQIPGPDTMVDSGSTVRVTVASGVEQVPMPDLRNKTEALAVQEIVTAGLAPGAKTEAFDPTVPAGLVASQNPRRASSSQKGRRSTT
jgi:serine/threonine-protein kinase